MNSVYAIKKPIPRRAYLFIVVLSFLLPLGLYSTISYGQWVEGPFTPTPTTILAAGRRMAFGECSAVSDEGDSIEGSNCTLVQVEAVARFGKDNFTLRQEEGTLLGDLKVSLMRIGLGFLASAALAVPLGLFMGTWKAAEAAHEPFVSFIRYMPAVAFLPLVFVYLGIGEGAKVFIIFLGTYFALVQMVTEVVRKVPQGLVDSAYLLGAGRWQVLGRVIWPHSLPGILESLRASLGLAWTYLVVSELVASEAGLGYRIMKSQRFLKVDQIILIILLIGLLGLLSDVLLRKLNAWLFPWEPGNRRSRLKQG